MPIIEIKMMSGRTIDQKRLLVKLVTEAVCESINTQAERVKIKLTDMTPDNYATSGKLIMDQNDSSGK